MTEYSSWRHPDLSQPALAVINSLLTLPLSTIDDLVHMTGIPARRVRPAIDELKGAGLVECAVLAWTVKRLVRRWYLTREGLEGFRLGEPTWHHEGNLGEMLFRLPQVESFYPMAWAVEGLGRPQTFQWLAGVSLDAAVRYEEGWAGFLWSGLRESEGHIANRLGSLGQDLLGLAATGQLPWPATLCFAVSDPWQGELVRRAARLFSEIRDRMSVWCVAEEGPPRVVADPQAGRGWIHQPVDLRAVGGWSWAKRLESSPWTKPGNVATDIVLAAVDQWPGLPTGMAKEALGEGRSGRSAQRCLSKLLDLGLVERQEDEHSYCYFLTSGGYQRLTRRDGVPPVKAKGERERAENRMRREPKHEQGLRSLMGQFMAAGLATAVGSRSWEHLGEDGAIAPDGLVRLNRCPYGPTWAYVEYELSARGQRRVAEKLRGYLAGRRQDRWPVLFVCWNAGAEAVFHQVGREHRLPMLTATIDRLEKSGPFGNQTWSMYGQPATIG